MKQVDLLRLGSLVYSRLSSSDYESKEYGLECNPEQCKTCGIFSKRKLISCFENKQLFFLFPQSSVCNIYYFDVFFYLQCVLSFTLLSFHKENGLKK